MGMESSHRGVLIYRRRLSRRATRSTRTPAAAAARTSIRNCSIGRLPFRRAAPLILYLIPAKTANYFRVLAPAVDNTKLLSKGFILKATWYGGDLSTPASFWKIRVSLFFKNFGESIQSRLNAAWYKSSGGVRLAALRGLAGNAVCSQHKNLDFSQASWFNFKRYWKYLTAVARPKPCLFSLIGNWHGRVWTE